MSMMNIFNVSSSAASAQSQRLNVVASNLANADTVAGPNGQAYKARQVTFQTELMGEGQASDPRAMPLTEFIAEVMAILAAQPNVAEVVVGRCEPLRFAAENGNAAVMFQTINSMSH